MTRGTNVARTVVNIGNECTGNLFYAQHITYKAYTQTQESSACHFHAINDKRSLALFVFKSFVCFRSVTLDFTRTRVGVVAVVSGETRRYFLQHLTKRVLRPFGVTCCT